VTPLSVLATLVWLVSIGAFAAWMWPQQHPKWFYLSAALGLLSIVLTRIGTV
jgi:hypothetical protein